MDNNLPVPGFTDDDFGGMNFDIPAALNEAPDVSRLPEANITYADDESTGRSTLRAFESTTYVNNSTPQKQENMHEFFEREARDTGPSYSMESRGYHEPTWGDASAKTAERMNEAQVDSYGDMGGLLSIFNTKAGDPVDPSTPSTPNETQEVLDPIEEAVINYIEEYYSEQLKKCKSNLPKVLAKAVSKKIKEKILPDYFEKKVGDGTPRQSVRKEVHGVPRDPKTERFDFKKFVTTDF